MKVSDLDNFTRHYLIAALWSSTDEDGNPLEWEFGLYDFAESALQRAAKDCADFQKKAESLLGMAYESDKYQSMRHHPDCGGKLDSMAGHDFWLSRNDHGAGFFDRGNEPFWHDLQGIASNMGELHIEKGDDGELYFL